MKRIFDVAAVILLFLVLSPVLVFICVLQCIALKSWDIFYTQIRIGSAGRNFGCYKFRTMVFNAEVLLKEHLAQNLAAQIEWNTTHKLQDDPRVTRIGRHLRALSLDELPQLWNILRGDMSLVGPRPITQLELTSWYGPLGADSHYLSVRPGLTGLWQTSGRSGTSYPERVALDKQYVEQISFRKDVRILYRTFWAVVRREGAW